MTPRCAVFYTRGQSRCGTTSDDELIIDALRAGGLDARLHDLADIRIEADGTLSVRDRATAEHVPWDDPEAALMYHGAIAPADAMDKLRAMEARGTVVVNGPDAWPVLSDKHRFAEYAVEHGIRAVPTRVATSVEQMREAHRANGGESVFKLPIGTEGDEIFVVRGEEQLEQLAALLDELGGRLIAQPIVDSRIGDLEPGLAELVLPEEFGRRHEFRVNTARLPNGHVSVDASYMRIAPDADQVVNNVAQGARPVRIDFAAMHPADRETVIDAARKAPPTGDLVGWDLIGQPGERMLIEGNSGSGLPDGSEGIDPREVVATYATVLRGAAERSSVFAAR